MYYLTVNKHEISKKLRIIPGTVPPPTTAISPDRRFFKHLSIIVPVVCAVVIVLVVTIVICVLHTRRNPPNRMRGPYDQGGKCCLRIKCFHFTLCDCIKYSMNDGGQHFLL